MKKLLCMILTLMLLLLTGCQKEEEVPTVITEYDLEEAYAMIDEAEWLIAWLSTQESIERDTAEALVRRIDGLLGQEGNNILTCAMADAADWEDESVEALALGNGTVAPTLYHEGVELVSATEETRCVLDDETGKCAQHFGSLAIRIEYTGSDSAFRGWYKEYVFYNHFSHGGDWTGVVFDGTYNLEGSLPLRSDFDPERYPIL